jgi:hypothetical protein
MISMPPADEFDQGPIPPALPEKLMKELFSLAGWFLQAEPWRKMYDSHTIVIVDPETGDRQLAVVMGNAGTLFAIHLYQPEEGTRWYSNMHLGGESPLALHNAQFDHRYLEIQWSDGSELDEHDEVLDDCFAPDDWFDEEDLDTLSAVTFRATIPGCPPWHPDEQSALRIADTLRLVRRYYEDHFDEYEWAYFTLDEDDHNVDLPTFILPKGARRDDPKAWTFAMENFQAPGPKELPQVLPDDLFVARLESLKVRPNTTVAFIGVHETSRAEGNELLSALKPREQLLRSSLAKAVEAVGYLPAEIMVGSPIAELALADLAKAKGIKITGDQAMPLFDDIANSLMQSPLFLLDGEDSPLADIAPEEVQRINQLMREMPEGDSPKEAAAFIEKLSALPGGEKVMEAFLKDMGALEDPKKTEESDGPKNAPDYRQPKSKTRMVFRVDLVGAKPPIWRRISVPDDATFFDLHLAMQAVFGWSGFHIHAFEVRGSGRRPELTLDWKGEEGEVLSFMTGQRAKEYEIQIGEFFHHNKLESLNYVYDFGDYWDHKIKFEKSITSDSPAVPILEVIKGKGSLMVEDCGGIHGLMALIEGDHPKAEKMDPQQFADLQAGTFDPKQVYPRDPITEIELMEELNDF